MEIKRQKIVFITPSLSNTGSEILLFQFINFLAPNHDLSVICFEKGTLIKSLNKSVNVYVVNIGNPQNIFGKFKRRFKIHFKIPLIFNQFKNHIWYINTILLPTAVSYAVAHKIDFVLHVHELEHQYGLLSKIQLSNALNYPKHLIANSAITKQHLIKAGTNKNVEIIYPFIDFNLIEPLKKNNKRVELETINWVMAGSIDENKNPDLFISIAKEAKRQNLPYTFTWLYQNITDENLFCRIIKTIKESDLLVEFILTDNHINYLNVFSKCSGLILTSKHESFSLVTLEALTLEMPIVVSDCGGVREIVDAEIASIVALNSSVDIYIECMKKEYDRRGLLNQKKSAASRLFDKDKILENWQKLF